ncbi:uncharacterized protein LOC106059732 [Biomphalaria glabrata]|uniref:Uncharacterized protein LOC106059732 n=1 Tax=Biomphalaria glabrata TaxID=6526 RepID=A0A9U8E4W1_BIOGL|nr:uncharacterized protein LOC106059732 [Biomphalaria glabrata]
MFKVCERQMQGKLWFMFQLLSVAFSEINRTNESQAFFCDSPHYDSLQYPQHYACRYNLCMKCLANSTFQEINSTLAIQLNNKSIETLIGQKNLISSTGNETQITFVLPESEGLFEGPTRFQFSVSGVDQDGNVTETHPWTSPEQYKSPTQVNFTVNGLKDNVVVHVGEVARFQCSADGYPEAVVTVTSQQMFSENVFNNVVFTSEVSVNVSSYFVSGMYSCSTEVSSNFIHQEIQVLVPSQLRTKDYILGIVPVQRVSADLKGPSFTIDVYGYPPPTTMILSSNNFVISEGVSVSYKPPETQTLGFGHIHIYFSNKVLISQYVCFNLTVDNGFETIFEFCCAECPVPTRNTGGSINSNFTIFSMYIHYSAIFILVFLSIR